MVFVAYLMTKTKDNFIAINVEFVGKFMDVDLCAVE